MAINKNAYNKEEALFLYKIIDLHELVQRYGFEFNKAKSSNNSKIYTNDNGDVISVKVGDQRGMYMWSALEKGKGGSASKFLTEYAANQFPSYLDAITELKRIAQTEHSGEYNSWKEQARKIYSIDSKGSQPNTLSRKPEELNINTSMVSEKEEAENENKVLKVFDFAPGEDLTFFIDRGIHPETLNHPTFQGRFGNHEGGFGDEEIKDSAPYKPDHLVYPRHIIVPYTLSSGQVVGLEAKNKLKPEIYEQRYLASLEQGKSSTQVKKNPSRFYPESSPAGIWVSNIPQNPSIVFISEQPADALAWFQLHKDGPNISNQTIFISTGGNLKDGQIKEINKIIKDHPIEKVILGFDNDVSGFSYAYKLYQSHQVAQDNFRTSLISTSKTELQLDFHLPKGLNPLAVSNEEFRKLQATINAQIESTLTKKSDYTYLPAISKTDRVGVLLVPYNYENSKELFQLISNLSPKEKLTFEVYTPAHSKDWNDALNKIDNATYYNSVHFLDHIDVRNKLFITDSNRIVIQRKVVNSEHGFLEPVGSIYNFEYNKSAGNQRERIVTGETYLGHKETDEALKNLKKDYTQLVPNVNTGYLHKLFNQSISYVPIPGEFVKNKSEVVAKFNEGEVEFIPSASLSPTEEKLVLAKALALEQGRPVHMKDFKIYSGKLFDGTYDNRGLRYRADSQEIIRYSEVGHISRERGEFVKSNSIALDPGVEKQINNLLPGYIDGSLRTEPNDSINIWQGKVRVVERLASFNGKRIELNDGVELSETDFDVLERFEEYLNRGRNPNTPGECGTLDEHFIFTPAPGFDPQLDLDPIKQQYYAAFLEEVKQLQKSHRQFREMYPEPLLPIRSENLILYYGAIPMYKYDPKSRGVILLSKEEDFIKRNFNPVFDKSLEIFIKNEGVFHNYIRNIRLDKKSKKIFFGDPKNEIGFLIKNETGQWNYCLYDSVPGALREEIRLLSPVPEASAEFIKSNNLDLFKPKDAAQVKEIKINTIPSEFVPFFNKKSEFITIPEQQVKHFPEYKRQKYMEAFLWNLSEKGLHQIDQYKSISKGVYEKDGEVYYNELCFGKYNKQEDKLEIFFHSSPQFYPMLAIIEKGLVKDIANRKFGQYLMESEAPMLPQKENHSEDSIKELLAKIEMTEEGLLRFRDKNLKIRNFGKLDGNTILVDKSISDFSDVFTESIQYLADKKKYEISYVASIHAEHKFISMGVPNIPVQEKDLVFNHEYRLTPENILKCVALSDHFKEKVRLTEKGTIEFIFLQGKNGVNAVPFGQGEGTQGIWMSNLPKEMKSIRVTESPEYALLFYQSDLARSIQNTEFYISLPGIEAKRSREIIDNLLQKYNVKTIGFTGSTEFTEQMENVFSTDNSLTILQSSGDLKKADTLKVINSLIAPIAPDMALQEAMDLLQGNNIFNVAQGVSIQPVNSPGTSSLALIGKQIKLSKDNDTLWFSKPVEKASQVVIAPDFKEAIYYMAINKEFQKDEAVIALQGPVTNEQVKMLNKILSPPRFDNSIFVVNTQRTYETLNNNKFKFPLQVINPIEALTFEMYFQKRKNDLGYVEVNQPVQSLGKNNAPGQAVIQEQQLEEHHNQVHSKTISL